MKTSGSDEVAQAVKKYFCNKKFRSLLFTGTITIIIQSLLLLSDTVIVGQILGEQELAAINVVQPFSSVAIFFSSLVSIGTSVFYSYEIGKFDKDKANALFGQGVILSSGAGLLMLIVGLIGKTPYFNYLELSDSTAASASDYYFFSQFAILLMPLYAVLLELVYAEGDDLICNISNILQIVVNVAASVFLCFCLGILGVGLGTLLGVICSIAVLLVHFFRKQNSLRFVWHISIKDTLKVMKCGITDSSAYLFMGLTSFVATKFVVSMFGEYYLPALLMVFNVIELTIVFDGIGQAVTPIVNIYRGEENCIGIKRVMKTALLYAVAEGVLLSLVLLLFGGQIAELFGFTDPELIDLVRTAVCLICPFFFCTGVLFLLTTYYMIIEKITLSTVITGIKDWIIPSAFICIFGYAIGINGVWIGLGLAPLVSIIAVLLFVYFRYGKDKFPLLFEKQTHEAYIFDTELTQQGVMKVRDEVGDLLSGKGISSQIVNRIMLCIEEIGMLTLENNNGSKVLMECSVLIGDKIQVILRDDGVICDVTDPDNPVSSLSSYMVAQMMLSMKQKRNLKAMGCNRNAFTFEKR